MGSFVVFVLLLSGFGVRVDEPELVGVVWDEVVCVARWLSLNGLILFIYFLLLFLGVGVGWGCGGWGLVILC